MHRGRPKCRQGWKQMAKCQLDVWCHKMSWNAFELLGEKKVWGRQHCNHVFDRQWPMAYSCRSAASESRTSESSKHLAKHVSCKLWSMKMSKCRKGFSAAVRSSAFFQSTSASISRNLWKPSCWFQARGRLTWSWGSLGVFKSKPALELRNRMNRETSWNRQTKTTLMSNDTLALDTFLYPCVSEMWKMVVVALW